MAIFSAVCKSFGSSVSTKGINVHWKIFVLLLSLLLPLKVFAAEGKESPVRDQMEAISRSFRTLNRQYADPAQKQSSLELVDAIQKHAETAKALTPSKAEKMSGDEQAKYLDKFHNHLDELIKEIGALKAAIAADKTDVAKVEMDKITQLRNSSHKDLGVEMGGRGKRGGPPPSSGQ